MRLRQITDDVLEEAVRAQEADEFDSHDVIFWMSRNRPREYVADLHTALQDAGDPFVNLHTAIARRLAALREIVQQQHRKVVSRNVRGEENECELWHRVGGEGQRLSDRLVELRRVLARTAKLRDVTHYRPVANILGIESDRLDHCKELADALDEISTFECGHDRPLLSVVVVREDNSRPGAGFFKMAKQNGVQRPEQGDEAFFVAELNRAYEYWQEHED